MPARPGPDTQLTYQWQWSEPEPEGGWEILRVKRDYGNPNLRDGWRRLSRLTPQYLALAQTHQFVFRISEDDDVRTEQKQDKLETPHPCRLLYSVIRNAIRAILFSSGAPGAPMTMNFP